MNLFLGNFDFEHHLGRSGPRVLPAQIRRLNNEMAFSLTALAEPGDCVWTPELPETEFAQHLVAIGLAAARFVDRAEDVPRGAVLFPWGWCKSAVDFGAAHGCKCDHPDLSAVAKANSREFSSGLEAKWDVGLPGARAIRTSSELDLVFSDAAKLPGGWVIKADFGMSARERIVGRSAPHHNQVEWARRHLQRGEPIFFEPWVESVAEFGCQFSVLPSGKLLLEGITGLLTDAQGTFRGSRLSATESGLSHLLEPSALEIVKRAAQRVQQLGYFGPLGIDVMQYRTSEGEIRWRPLQDLNARLTMGRVALGLRRLLKPGEWADWLHLGVSTAAFKANREKMAILLRDLATDARLVRTSPLKVGDAPTGHETALIIVHSPQVLDVVFATIR
ncbi:MAG TPA: hypothetical protein VEI07_07930 [Planctomycetaceae bacterium]|nr:hypothetical protein [Planctomycetaceae bacterium]